jgi:cytochrome c553
MRFFECKAAALLLALVPGFGLAQPVGNPEDGEQKAVVCAACHGPDGNSVNPIWPKIAGQGERYFIEQLKAFKLGSEGPRRSPNAALMYPMAANLSEQDMADLAAHFSGQEMSLGVADDELALQGQAIYRGGNSDTGLAACSGCHGPAGEGNPAAAYPELAGQHAQYVYDQLQAFRSGQRSGDPNAMMRNIAKLMSDEEMRAVAQYVQGLYRD